MKVNATGKKSPYNMSRTSSVGKYHGTGIPSKYGTRRYTYTDSAPKKTKAKPFGSPSRLY